MQCPLCEAIGQRKLLVETGHAVAMGDAWPLTLGHTLVVPRRHEADFFALTEEEMGAVIAVASRVKVLLSERHQPDGYNVGVNVGEAAGQTIAHAHLHVIPRYRGDVPDPRGGVRWIIPSKAAWWA